MVQISWICLAILLQQPDPARMIAGYPDRLSYVAGDVAKLHVSTTDPSWSIEIARIGADRQVVFSKSGLPGRSFPAPVDASSRGCRWPVSLEAPISDQWKSGYYSCTLTGQGAAQDKPLRSQFFFVVRAAAPGRDSRILLQLCTNTYNAYCNWGGYSLYAYNGRHKAQGRRVSFLRPISGDFARWEEPFVRWAESAGYKLDYAVNNDLAQRPELLKHYRLVLSVGHDEYWSKPMRDNLEAFIAAGGNVAFLSGNTCCWQVREEAAGSELVCYKQSFGDDPVYWTNDHRTLSTLWSHYLVNRPENLLTGVGFLHGGYHLSHGQHMKGSGAFTVHRPDHWLFAGTSLKRDEAFGGKDTIVGYECDGCELELHEGLPRATGRDGTPKDFLILATAPARWHPDDCEWYERWQKGRDGHAVFGTYTRGGTVITVGSTDWSHGLRGKDPAVDRITRNILDRLGR